MLWMSACLHSWKVCARSGPATPVRGPRERPLAGLLRAFAAMLGNSAVERLLRAWKLLASLLAAR